MKFIQYLKRWAFLASQKNVINNTVLQNNSSKLLNRQLSKNAINSYEPDLLINIPYNICGFFDYHKTKELIEIGVNKTKKILDSKKIV